MTKRFRFHWNSWDGWEWDQRLADLNRFSNVETRNCYSCLVLYLHVYSQSSIFKLFNMFSHKQRPTFRFFFYESNLLHIFTSLLSHSREDTEPKTRSWKSIVTKISFAVTIFLKSWKYNAGRNVKADFSIINLPRVAIIFWIGSCKTFHAKILIARLFMIILFFKNCAWLQQFHM